MMQIRVRQCICDPCEFETYQQQVCTSDECSNCSGYDCSFDVSPEYSGNSYSTQDDTEVTTQIDIVDTTTTQTLIDDEIGWLPLF